MLREVSPLATVFTERAMRAFEEAWNTLYTSECAQSLFCVTLEARDPHTPSPGSPPSGSPSSAHSAPPALLTIYSLRQFHSLLATNSHLSQFFHVFPPLSCLPLFFFLFTYSLQPPMATISHKSCKREQPLQSPQGPLQFLVLFLFAFYFPPCLLDCSGCQTGWADRPLLAFQSYIITSPLTDSLLYL